MGRSLLHNSSDHTWQVEIVVHIQAATCLWEQSTLVEVPSGGIRAGVRFEGMSLAWCRTAEVPPCSNQLGS